MKKIQKILYPTDFSELSQSAVPYVQEFARLFDAEVHCLHVVDEAYQYWMGAGETAVPIVIPSEDLKKTAEPQLDEFIKQHFGEDSSTLIRSVIAGRPFLEIIQYARENNIDMIIISTHGRGALASMLLGSVTEKVVRKAPCAVLTVRHPDHKFEIP